MAAFLIMSGLINGAFAALDAILFYVFFEGMLIPMYLIIGVWGGPRRVYASIKFFLYTLLGSLLMLVAFIYLYFQAGKTFDIQAFQALKQIPLQVQILLFIAFFLSFAVKVPMWPVHTWLLHGAGGDHAEDRCLRLPAICTADRAGCLDRAGPDHDRPVAGGGGVHRSGGTGANRHEKTGRLLLHFPHGLRDAGHVPVHR
ncbi:NADH-quinone oxidoreductase subunit M [compost metagenome]